jgi:hypothetical protein
MSNVSAMSWREQVTLSNVSAMSWREQVTLSNVSAMSWREQVTLSNVSAMSWRERVTFNEMMMSRLVLDQHALFDFYSVSSLNQQSVGRHVASPRHIILIPS